MPRKERCAVCRWSARQSREPKEPAAGITEGIKVFEGLVAEQPENGLNHVFLGRLQARRQNFEAAERAFAKVQELAPQWAEGYRAMAELYLRADRKTDKACLLAGKAADLEPSGTHYYLLALARLKSKDRPGSLEAAQRALALSPKEKRYQQLLEQLAKQP